MSKAHAKGIFILALTVSLLIAATAELHHGAAASPTEQQIKNITYFSWCYTNYSLWGSEIAFKAVGVAETNYTWDFGDGTLGYGKYPMHLYTLSGNYTVTLITLFGDGGGNTLSQTLTLANDPPIPDFYWEPETPTTQETVYFWDNSIDPDHDILNWTWDFGDGATANGNGTEHRYAENGRYDVRLTVRDHYGSVKSVTKQIIVFNVAPEANFYWTKEGDDIRFLDYSTDIDGAIVNWTWNFGDDTTSYQQNPLHSYSDDDIYTVILTVRDDDDTTHSIQKTVDTYNKLPTVIFFWSPINPTILETVLFNDSSIDLNGDIVNWTWNFGDSTFSHQQHPTHKFAQKTEHQITLTVIDDGGALNSLTKHLQVVNAPPVANFTWQPIYQVDGENISFFEHAVDHDGHIINWTWDFGDGVTGYIPNATHAYADSGTYQVTLTVTDDNGAFGSVTQELMIANVYVDDDADPTWYDARHVRTIQEGVFNASTYHHIYVLSGTYKEQVVVNKLVNISGVQAVLDAGGIGDALTLNVEGVLIHHMTVTNASNGRGICVNAANISIHNCTLTDNKIAIYLAGDYATFMDNTIRGYSVGKGVVIASSYNYVSENYFGQLQNATQVLNGMENTIENNHYSGNVFAVQIESGTGTKITDNLFSSANSYGIDVMGDNWCILDNNTFYNNGEALNVFCSGIRIANHTFDGNTLAIGIYADNTTVTDSLFLGNQRGVHIDAVQNTVIADCIVSNNHYGIVAEHAIALTITNITFTSQEYEPLIIQQSVQATVSMCAFADNGDYPALVNESESVEIAMCSFDNQTSGLNVSFSSALIHNCTFTDHGTAMQLYGSSKISVTNIVINNATRGIFATGSSHSITATTIHHTAYGIYASSASNLSIMATLHHNTYGLYLRKTEDCQVSHVVLHNNTYALYLHEGRTTLLANAILQDNDKGMIMINTSTNSVNGSFFEGNRIGIEATDSEHNEIYQSTITANHHGLVLSKSSPTNIISTLFLDNEYSIDIEGSTSEDFLQYFELCTVNGKPVEYLINETSRSLIDTSFGYLGLVNCVNITIDAVDSQPNGEGMLVVNCSDIKIANSTFAGHIDGLVCMHISDSKITNTSVSTNVRDGMVFTGCSDITIDACSIEDNEQRGINAYSIDAADGRFVISQCIINNNWLGINVENIHYNQFIDNIVTGNQKAGVRFFSSNHNELSANYIAENEDGITVAQSSFLTVLNITLENNNRSLYLSSVQSIDIADSSFEGSTMGLWSQDAEIIIRNTSFHGHTNATFFLQSDAIVRNSTFSNNTYSIHAVQTSILIDACQISNNHYGIYLLFSNGSSIYNCLELYGITNNIYGIVVNQSHNVYMADLSLSENENGLQIFSSVGVFVSNITAFNNSYALSLEEETMKFLLNYSLFHHNSYAIVINGTNNTVVNCSLWQNIHGIRILKGFNNTIYHNNFAYNWYQAVDKKTNTWDGGYPAGGNYWSDYAGVDVFKGIEQNLTGSDGIGDIPYGIAKGVNQDTYSLMAINVNASPMPNKAPAALFSHYPTQPFSGDMVIFIDKSTDPNGETDIVAWNWDFGDGNNSTKQHPQHAYAQSGTYTVSLTIDDHDGVSSTNTVVVNISDIPPEADFTYTPALPTTGENIAFTDTSTDQDGYIVNWTWDFGDGTTSQEQNATHTYYQPGVKTVILTVTDNTNNTSTTSKRITVENTLPISQFSIDPRKPDEGEPVNFTDVSSDDGDIVSWHWDFGDGTASDQQEPQHVYKEGGTYTITLTVRDNDGGENTATKTITIRSVNDTPGYTLILVLFAAVAVISIFNRKQKHTKL